MRKPWRAAAAALGLLALAPATTSALMVWTLLGSPLIATANQATTFTLTATNLDLLAELGCLEVDLPVSFVIVSTGSPSASNGDDWSAATSGQAVLVYSESGGGRLELGETVTFTIRARPTVAGAFTWPNHAHRQQDCSGTDQPGVALAITVLAGPAPTATPTPSPSPSPSPVPTPTPSPSLPLPSLPVPSLPVPSLPLPSQPLPSLSVLPSPTPTVGSSPSPISSASPSARPDASSPTASATPDPDRTPAGSSPGGSGSGPGSSGASPAGSGGTGGLRLAPDSRGLDGLGAGFGIVDVLADVHLWFVPAAAVGVPGLLLIVWVALQAAGVLAWIPAVRRMSGDGRDRRPGQRS